jgi:hypothetical protein
MPAFSLAPGYWTDKEVLGDLNFRWPELFTDVVALGPGEDVAALHHHDLAHLDGLLCEEAAPVDGARTFLDLRREITQAELTILHGLTFKWCSLFLSGPQLSTYSAMKGPRHHQHAFCRCLAAGGLPARSRVLPRSVGTTRGPRPGARATAAVRSALGAKASSSRTSAMVGLPPERTSGLGYHPSGFLP